MAANPYLQLVERRQDQKEIHVLFVGPALAGTKNVFQRDEDPVRCDHAHGVEDAMELLTERAKSIPFDCVMIDMRREEDGNPLNVVSIAALGAAYNVVVLSAPDMAETFENMVGVDEVLSAPVDPKAIIRTIVTAGPLGELPVDLDEEITNAEVANTEGVDEQIIVEDEVATKSDVTPGFETSLSKAAEIDRAIWQRFVPIVNFAYKKLAIFVLGGLFLAFLAYGAMIVFFMVSTSWSLPLELSRGHSLVEKAGRDLSSMRVRQNQINLQLSQAQLELANAKREERDGKLSLVLSKRTIEEETTNQIAQKLEVEKNIKRLKQVIQDFNKLNNKGGFARNLASAYARRLITRKSLNSGTLAVLETMHRIATVENEVSVKQLEADRVNRRLEFLKSLASEVDKPEVRVVTSAGSDLSHLAREVIETKNRIASAQKVVEASAKRQSRIENSLSVITRNIVSLEATPAARALIGPVAVLFVPYTNTDSFNEGDPIYGCALSIIWCSKAGEVGKSVNGETVSVHPLFGKPMRGTFVEAKFSNSSEVFKELIHAGGAPLLF